MALGRFVNYMLKFTDMTFSVNKCTVEHYFVEVNLDTMEREECA